MRVITQLDLNARVVLPLLCTCERASRLGRSKQRAGYACVCPARLAAATVRWVNFNTTVIYLPIHSTPTKGQHLEWHGR